MKKLVGIFLVLMLVIGISTIFAQDDKKTEDIKTKVENVTGKKVENITKLNSEELKQKLNAIEIKNNSVGVFEVKVQNSKPLFAITASTANPAITTQTSYSVSLLTFGVPGEINDSSFMATSAGSLTSADTGYVMLGNGSITGISTSLETTNGKGTLQVVIMKNGVPINFGNEIHVASNGAQKDYDIQSRDIVNFQSGDVISIYLKNDNGVVLRDATTLVQISSIQS